MPHECVFTEAGESMYRVGITQLEAAMNKYKECIKNDRWPGYADGKIIVMEIPDKVMEHEAGYNL